MTSIHSEKCIFKFFIYLKKTLYSIDIIGNPKSFNYLSRNEFQVLISTSPLNTTSWIDKSELITSYLKS